MCQMFDVVALVDLPRQHEWKEFHAWDNCQSGCIRSDTSWQGCEGGYLLVRRLLHAGATCASRFRSCVSSSFRLLPESDHSPLCDMRIYFGNKTVPCVKLCVVVRNGNEETFMFMKIWGRVKLLEKVSTLIIAMLHRNQPLSSWTFLSQKIKILHFQTFKFQPPNLFNFSICQCLAFVKFLHFQGPAAAVDMPGLRKPESPVKEFDKVPFLSLSLIKIKIYGFLENTKIQPPPKVKCETISHLRQN